MTLEYISANTPDSFALSSTDRTFNSTLSVMSCVFMSSSSLSSESKAMISLASLLLPMLMGVKDGAWGGGRGGGFWVWYGVLVILNLPLQKEKENSKRMSDLLWQIYGSYTYLVKKKKRKLLKPMHMFCSCKAQILSLIKYHGFCVKHCSKHLDLYSNLKFLKHFAVRYQVNYSLRSEGLATVL